MEVVSVIWSPKLPLLAARSAFQPCMRPALYRAWGSFGLSSARPGAAIMVMVLIGIGAGGCSFSRGDGGLAKFGGDAVTASLAPPPPTHTHPAFPPNPPPHLL